MNAITLNDAITDALERNEFRLCGINKQDDEYVAEVEFYSPLGEDFIMTIFFDGTNRDFVQQFQEYYYDYDADAHAADLIEYRGTNGVPSSIRDILDDAEAIDSMIKKMSNVLNRVFRESMEEEWVRNNWEKALCSLSVRSISAAIGYGFAADDIRELARLHREDPDLRGKIEDLLTDCNFHAECAHFHAGNYESEE